jgi:hypothetical protein
MAGGAAQARLSVRARWHGHRIIGHAFREVVHVNSDGTISPLVEGSTAPTKTIDHAGIIKVIKFKFRAPFF